MLRPAISISIVLILAAASPLSSRAQDQSTPAATQKQSKAPKANPDKDAPASNSDTAPTQKKSSADENPFPEEQSKSAAKQVEEGKAPSFPGDVEGESPSGKDSQPDAGNLPSKDGGVSSSRSRLEGLDQGDQEVARKALPKVSDMAHNPKMAAEDVAIGTMYFQSENYRGAYIRYKEALSLDPESPDAAFGVAETARKLNQPKEAIESYQLCLNLDPTGHRSKAAKKALAALSSATTR